VANFLNGARCARHRPEAARIGSVLFPVRETKQDSSSESADFSATLKLSVAKPAKRGSGGASSSVKTGMTPGAAS
jgi:hypothetical protein